MTPRYINNAVVDSIVDVYWSMFEKGDTTSINSYDVCVMGNIDRNTFDKYFESASDILAHVEEEQLYRLEKFFESTEGMTRHYVRFVKIFREYFLSNARYLVPLVLDYRDPAFSFEYRSMLEDRMFKDLDVVLFKRDERSVQVIDIVISGIIDIFLRSVAVKELSDDDLIIILEGYMDRGLRMTLKDNFGIYVSMNHYE